MCAWVSCLVLLMLWLLFILFVVVVVVLSQQGPYESCALCALWQFNPLNGAHHNSNGAESKSQHHGDNKIESSSIFFYIFLCWRRYIERERVLWWYKFDTQCACACRMSHAFA